MADTKTEWRVRLLRARGAIDAGRRDAAAAAIAARLVRLPAFARAHAVLLYVAIGAEVDVDAAVAKACRGGKPVYRPACDAPEPLWTLHDAACERRDHLTKDLPFPMLMIVPGVGFDADGRRLGRGQGYYDRAIAAARAAGEIAVVGVAFEEQLADRLPQDPWDQRVDVIVTERRVLVPQPSRRDDSGAREEVRDDL